MKHWPTLLKENWKSGLTVGMVSVPLSISLAIASGAGPLAGIITAIWAGLFAALFGGSKFNVIGPAGALSGVLTGFVLTYGIESLATLTVLSAGFIFLAYLLRLDRFLCFVPASTVHGFILGVAVIIALNQLNFAFGLTDLPQHSHFIKNVAESFRNLHNADSGTALVFFTFLATLLFMAKKTPQLPGVILLAPLGILLGYASQQGWVPLDLQTLGEKFGNIQAKLWQPISFTWNDGILTGAITVALVSVLETMISARVADGMTKTTHNARRELLGLSLANIASGLAGGLPATGVLVRTSLNARTGATHQTSQGLNALFVAIISILFLSAFSEIPMAVIASMLVFTSIRMVETHHLLRFLHHDRWNFFIALGVAAITIIEDPLYGLILGTAISLIFFVEKLSHGEFDLTVSRRNHGPETIYTEKKLKTLNKQNDILVYSIKGHLAYMNGEAHMAHIKDSFSHAKYVVLRLRELYFIDLDGVETFDEMVEFLEGHGKTIFVSSINRVIEAQLLRSSKHYKRLKTTHRVHKKTSEALLALGLPLKVDKPSARA